MYARTFSATVQPDSLDEAARIVQDLIVPVAKVQKGFAGLVLMLDQATGKCLLVSTWATEADRAASETNGFLRAQLGKLAALVAGPPTVERYEVAVRG